MAAEAEMQALKNHTNGSEEAQVVAPPVRPKGPPESATKFVIKLVLICAAILAVGVGVCVALIVMGQKENVPKGWTCQTDASSRLFTITLNGTKTQYYLSSRQSTWSGGDRLCKTIAKDWLQDEGWFPMAGLASIENDQDEIINHIVSIQNVTDFWTSGYFGGSESEWLWRNDNSSFADQLWAGDMSSIEEDSNSSKKVCLGVDIVKEEDETSEKPVWKSRDCNFPSQFLCQAECQT